MKPRTMTQDEVLARSEILARQVELDALIAISFSELDVAVRKWLLVVDPGIIKLLPAIVVSNKLPRDPVWVFLIGPSGAGKTEFLNAMFDLKEVYPLSLLTPNTFLSGVNTPTEMSLLPRINNKILIFKDWTNILSQNKDARNEIMGQLREIYDGHMKKTFGNGKVSEWHGKVGMLAGTTPAIDMAQQMHATLGERFIHYHLITPDRKSVARKALDNSCQIVEMRKELRNAFYSFIKGITIPKTLPIIPDSVKDEIVSLSNFAALARSGVIREYGMKKEVIFVPAAEMPTRITQQLDTLATSLIIVNNGVFLPEDMKIIYKIALDSIPQTNRMVMAEMARQDRRTTAEIAMSIGYPTAPIRMYLENLALLGVCKRIKSNETEEGGIGDRWLLQQEFVEILRRYDKISPISSEPEEQLTLTNDI